MGSYYPPFIIMTGEKMYTLEDRIDLGADKQDHSEQDKLYKSL